MVSIDNSANRYKVSNSGLNQAEIKNTLDKSSQTVSDNFESNSIGKVLMGGEDSNSRTKAFLLVPPLMVADGIVDNLMGGKGGILKHASNLGDKISHTLHLDKIISKENGSKISEFIKNNRFLKYFTSDYKAVPRTSFAKGSKMIDKFRSEMIEQLGAIASNPEFSEITSTLSEETAQTLTAAAESAKSSGLSAEKVLKAADELISKGVDKIQTGKLTKKQINLSSLRNKLATSASKMGKTSLGRGFAKALLGAKEKFTYGGGLISLFFTASALVNAYNAAKDAPKGEKKSTFMHVLSEQYLGFLLFQPSISMMYKIGGNKYRGMTVEGREALKNLVASTNANEALTKEGLKIAKMQRNLLIKGVDKDKVAELAGKTLKEAKTMAKGLKKEGAKLKFWERPLKFIGKLLDTGLDKMQKPTFINLKKKLPIIGDKIKVPKPTLKGFAGGLARFAIIMFVLQPLLQKPLTKLAHKIFGTPTTYLAKQEAKNGAKKNDKTANGNTNNEVPNSSETNLLKKWTQLPEEAQQPISPVAAASIADNQNTQNNTQPSQETPSAALNLFKKKPERYIPQIEPPVEEDNSKEIDQRVKNILKNTDVVLKNSKKYL
jgi:hypothetical protein